MTDARTGETPGGPERAVADVDIACVGYGPAAAGFLQTLAGRLTREDGAPAFESESMPGMPLQVVCYERADDIGFGVSGVVTRGRALRESMPGLKPEEIPTCAPVGEERLLYLLDPVGASRRSGVVRAADAMVRAVRRLLPYEREALRLPWIPGFLRKEGGFLFSLGQFQQWVAGRIMEGGVQIWPGMPVAEPLLEGDRVAGVRMVDQGVDREGRPGAQHVPGMDIRARLTVVADGPFGPVGQALDDHFGLPPGYERREWAIGAKMVIRLRDGVDLAPGTVFHTIGYPEPGIFGFLYVYPDRTVSVGIFVNSWFESPVRTTYRYLQHWMLHPYLWQYLEGGTLQSWGAKSLLEAGRRGEPHLVGNGYARIGEGSGSTNILTGSGVDEAWATGVHLAEGVLDLLAAGRPFTGENLEATYVARRRASWVEKEARVAARSRDGFHLGFVPGLLGMALCGLTGGRLWIPGRSRRLSDGLLTLEEYFHGRIPPEEIARIRKECQEEGVALHGRLMERAGWPTIPFDGTLLVSHQDALLLGGKVQAPEGYADHVIFLYPELCERCSDKVCIEVCSGQAIVPGTGGVPSFDREKCVHCGACLWNCSRSHPEDPEKMLIAFRAGAGGLHSAEN